jgi:glycosyltransferase involved in cell wall biosynthesis
MPKVSVIIPTFNRPDMISRAIQSVFDQNYKDYEIIVVDDGVEKNAENTVLSIASGKIKYIKHETSKGGGAARNTGIKNSSGEYIAFLDDDDEWLPEKLSVQMEMLEKTGQDVGFSFTSVVNVKNGIETVTTVPVGINDYHERALRRFSGFLTVTLIIKRFVFDEVGFFDERFPSHQEPDLMIRVTKKYKGLAINIPLTRVNMNERVHINSSLANKINGRKMILEKYAEEYKDKPNLLAKHYFDLAVFYRDDKRFDEAKNYFKKSIRIDFRFPCLAHYLKVCLLKIVR